MAIKSRLSSLSKEELKRIVDNVDIICFDEFNYDVSENKYCPLAVAMNLHNSIISPTDEKIKQKISERFNPVNILKGLDGAYYRNNRRDDLINLCNDILNDNSR